MVEPTKHNPFSGPHWDLHRNSLLFSALLLILCIPGVKAASAQNFLWLSFSDVGLFSLRLMALVAATYAFAAYVLEWMNEPRSIFKEANNEAKTSREKLDRLVDSASAELESAILWLNQNIAKAEEARSPYLIDLAVQPRPEQNEFVERVYREYNQDPIHSPGLERNFELEVMRMRNRNAPYHEVGEAGSKAIRTAALIIGRKIDMEARRDQGDRFTIALEQATESANNLSSTLERFITRKLNIPSLRVAANISIFKWQSYHFGRIVLIGLLVPLFVYSTAVAHFLGQAGVAHLPSIFCISPKDVCKAAVKLKRSNSSLASASTKG